MDLADTYLKLVGTRKLYPALNNYSIFIQGSEYNTERYERKWCGEDFHLDLFIHIKEGFSQVWLPEDDLKQVSRMCLKECLNNPSKFALRGNQLFNAVREVDKAYDEYTYEKVKGMEWPALLALVSRVRDTIWDANSALAFTIYLDKEMCLQVLKEENHSLSEKKLDALWERAIEPAFESFDKSQSKDFLGLMKKGVEWSEIVERCQYFLADYHSARGLREVEGVLKERYGKFIANPRLASEALKIETLETEHIAQTHKEWLAALPENEKAVAEYLQSVMMLRDRRKNFFAKAIVLFHRVAEKMFEEVGIDASLIPFYSIRDLLKGVEFLKASAGDLKGRKKGYQWLVPYVGEPQGLSRNIDAGVEKINSYFKKCHEQAGEIGSLKGQSAFKGVVKGRARVVLDMNADHGFKEGDILITGMTRPEYVPLMKKAAAIVTDEGGITCHAAIISRELKKPCIIGTKIATKVIKDCDMVEVDAEKGVVRILK